MYCSNCGSKNDGNLFCTNCGIKLDNGNNIINNNVKKKEENGLKIASIVLGVLGILSCLNFIFFIFGFILSLIGLILGICATKKGKNVLGILLNSIGLFLSIIMFGLFMFFIMWASEYETENDDYYDYWYNDGYYEKFENIIDRY